jgi:5-methylcytosine-specific restriction endonuclease McrA
MFRVSCGTINLSTRTSSRGFAFKSPCPTTHRCAQSPCFESVYVLASPGRHAGTDQGGDFAIMVKSIRTYLNSRVSSNNFGAFQRHMAFGKIPPKDVLLRMELQNWECFYCGDKISLFTCEMDHVHALAKGGDNYLYNVVLTCRTCNRTKGVRSLKRFCQIMGFDVEVVRQKWADLNQRQHDLTEWDDEYKHTEDDWST